MLKLIRKVTKPYAHYLIHMIAHVFFYNYQERFTCSSVKLQMDIWSEVQGG